MRFCHGLCLSLDDIEDCAKVIAPPSWWPRLRSLNLQTCLLGLGFSDLDMIMQLPYSAYQTYDGYAGNGQSALLQAVKTSVEKTYSKTSIKADGQVIVIPFTDGISFELRVGDGGSLGLDDFEDHAQAFCSSLQTLYALGERYFLVHTNVNELAGNSTCLAMREHAYHHGSRPSEAVKGLPLDGELRLPIQ